MSELGKKQGRPGDAGATLIELAIALPIFFALLFVVIDAARISVAYSSVRSATTLASRYAVSISRSPWKVFGPGFLNLRQDSLVAPGLLKNFTPEFTNISPPPNWYETQATAQNIGALHALEVRAIAFANEILRREIGDIRYPCAGQRGCARCFPIRDESSNSRFADYFSVAGPDGRSWRSKMTGITCEVDSPIISTAVALGWLPRFLTLSATSYTPLESTPDDAYTLPN